jgi:NAD(P)-dependent dehydrogenase (short-subunit alcohol dehydrogenase family)
MESGFSVAPSGTKPCLIGRMGVPDDIAHAVSFLASDGAGFVTGQRIVVDGGRALT